MMVDSLGNVPRKQSNDLMLLIEERYFKRPAFEPYEETKFFDFSRLFMVEMMVKMMTHGMTPH